MFIDAKYKLDIRDWKQTGHKLVDDIDAVCKSFTVMHYNEIIMTTTQYEDIAKIRKYDTEINPKVKFMRTNKGFIMEVKVDDN